MEQSKKQKIGYICRRTLPYLPIIGVPLTIKYHGKYGDTGIEGVVTMLLTALIQSVSIGASLLWSIAMLIEYASRS